MDKVKKNIAAAYKSLQLAKLEIERLRVLGKPHEIPEDEVKLLCEIHLIVTGISA